MARFNSLCRHGLLLVASWFVAQSAFSDDDVIRRAREQTIENQRAHAAAIALVVWEQIEINNPGDVDAACRQFDAWAAANGVVEWANSRVAETLAETEGMFEPDNRPLIEDSTRLRRTEFATDSLRQCGDEAARQRMSDAGLFIGPGSGNAPIGDDPSLAFPRLDPAASWNARFLKGAEDEFAAIIQNMPPSPPEVTQPPSLPPPTVMEQLLNSFDLAWQALAGGSIPDVDDVAGAGAATATEHLRAVMAILDRAREVDRRMETHNDNYPDIPDPIPENQRAMWAQIIEDYNAEAKAINAEKENVMTLLRAWSGP